MKLNDKELRIGNYVNEPAGHLHRIERTAEDTKRTRYGVPLTEEWMLKLGFDKAVELIAGDVVLGFGLKITPETAIIFNDGNVTLVDVDLDSIIIEVKFEYVHQLQNLYFALTFEELTIK